MGFDPNPNGEAIRARRWSVRLAVLVLCGGLGFSTLVGCGESTDEELCSRTCLYGVCDAETGKCVNAESCVPGAADPAPADGADRGGEESPSGISDCLAGYSCVEGSCEPNEACSSDGDSCERGVCDGEACINPSSCSETLDCRPGYECVEGSCAPTGCAEIECPRGVCDPETGSCANRDRCPNEEGDKPACLADHKCYDHSCYPEESFCEEVECIRGTCDPEEAACVNAEECEGDAECTEGYYCSDDGACEENQCHRVRKICDRGVCDPGTGDCGNPETCSKPEECLPMYTCVEGTCLPESEKCGREGCPGNQVCGYDRETLTASCEENPDAGCTNALDCIDQRVCREGTCGPGGSCENDRHEPNDSDEEATDYFEAQIGEAARGTVCSGDRDEFVFDTADDPDFRGRFAVSLQVDSVDVGVGELRLAVEQPDGTTWAEEFVGAEERAVLVDRSFGAAEPRGEYTITVEDTGSVHGPGVEYELAADIIGQEVVDACETPEEIDLSVVEGNTSSGESIALDASCVSDAEQAAENIYQFEVEEKSFVEIGVDPDDDVDIAASIRDACTMAATERHCSNTEATGGEELLADTFEPGTYYLIVQGAGADEGGRYTVSYESEPVVCTDADNHCIDADTASVCSPQGQEMETVECSNGCDRSIGACRRPEGDVCRNATEISGRLRDHEFEFEDYGDDFEAAGTACLGGESPAVGGPDKVFALDLAAGDVLLADLAVETGTDGSLYLLNECGDASGFCTTGTDTSGTTETLRHPNDSDSSQRLYLVADSADGASGTATLNVEMREIVCEPGATRCDGSQVEACNEAGTRWEGAQQCSFGCAAGACESDTCSDAFDVSSGGRWTFNPNNYDADYTLDFNSCVGSSLDGPDLVFQADVPSGEVLQASVTESPGSQLDAAIYIVEDCSSTQRQEETCVAASDELRRPGRESTAVRNDSSTEETYYIVVDANQSSGSAGTWVLNVDIEAPICSPGSTRCDTSDTLEYCNSTGLSWESYTCQGSDPSCTTSDGTARCDDPAGDICADAIPVSAGETKSGTLDGTDFITLDRGTNGQCEVDFESSGSDDIYEIDLEKDDLLRVDLQSTLRAGQLYLLEDCYATDSCRSIVRSGSGETLYYRATQDRTVYVVVDSFSTLSGDYDVTFNVTPNATCIPGERTCTDSTTAAKCNSTGSSYASTYSCTNGCSQGTCQFDSAAVDSCQTAPNLTDGTLTTVDMSAMSDDVTLPSSSCTGVEEAGEDAVFEVDASGGEVIAVDVDSQGLGDDPAVYISSSCGNTAQNCVAGSDVNSDGQPESLSYRVPSGQGGTYYVYLDANASHDATEVWDVEIQVDSPICQPGSILGCSSSTELAYCSKSGLQEKTHTCTGSTSPKCQNGECTEPSGDVCVDPISLSGGQTVQSSFSGSDDLTLPSGSIGDCTVNSSTTGEDDIYEVQLQQDDLLYADLSTTNPYAQLYVVEDCMDASSCREFTDAGQGGELYYRAASDQTVYLVVDTYLSTSANYTLTTDVTPNATCVPNSTDCLDSTTAALCDGTGTSYVSTFNCANSCTNGACQFSNTDIETCSTAPSVGSGTLTTIDMSTMNDDVTLPSTSCTGTEEAGHDAVFEVTASEGEVIAAEAESRGSGDEPAVYIADSCGNTAQNCVAGSDSNSDGEPESVHYTVPSGQGGSYYVYFDANGTHDSQEVWDVAIRTGSTVCTPGNVTGCAASDFLEYCAASGLYTKTYACGGTTSPRCQSGVCEDPKGDICADPVVMSSSGQETFTFDMSSHRDYITLDSSACTNNASPGRDAIVEVQVSGGDTVDVDVSSSDGGDNPMIYIADDCFELSQSGSNGCVAGSDSNGDGSPESLSWTVPQGAGGTYYVVSDAEADFDSSGTFTVDITIQ